MKFVLPALLIAAFIGAACPGADARPVRYHYLHRHLVSPARIGVVPEALLTNRYGDIILDGTTGFHRSDWGVMVPDSEPPSVVATGRATGTGPGASGLPGRNWQ